MKPTAVAPGGGAFTLTVYGANFVPGAVVNWNGRPRSTTFVSAHELQAQILATDIAKNTAGMISVTNPTPGGGNSSSSWAQVEVHTPTATIAPGYPYLAPMQFPWGGGPVVLADFSGDHKLDLIYGGIATLGKGDGTFRFTQFLQSYYPPWAVVYGDFNGDGKRDLAYVDGDTATGNVPEQIQVALGNGTGKFTQGFHMHNPQGFLWMVTGDFNRDGKLDLITVGGNGADTVGVFLGKGDGTFHHFVNYTFVGIASAGVSTLEAADFNGDGKLDLLTVDSSGNIYLAFGNGDGTFQYPGNEISSGQPVGCSAGSYGQEAIVDDFNADGKLDFAACDEAGGHIEVFLGNGDGTFQPPVMYPVGPPGFFQVQSGDFNSDGKPDLIVTQYGSYNGFSIFLGNGDGTFQPQQPISLALPYNGEAGIAAGDFNADGLLDFILVNGAYLDVVFDQK